MTILLNKRSTGAPLAVTMVALGLSATVYFGSSALAQGGVTVTGVASKNSTVIVYFNAVAGARDYRIYDTTNPTNVKYAGLTNEKSQTPVPATQIDWNNVGDGAPHTLIVEAVDALGPTPPGNLYNPDTNLPLTLPLPAGSMTGGNKGPTPDGKTSTNGQGPFTNNPQVIARSQPFVVQIDRNYKAIPLRSDATSTFFDTFENSEAATITKTVDIPYAPRFAPLATYTMNAGTPLAWKLQYQLADTINSMPFISSGHFMDVLFDGGNPGGSLPLHQGHGVMAMSPDANAAWGAGQILHVTQEVDGHTNGRRWMDIVIVPANDPAVAFDADTDAYNSTNNALRLQFFNQESCTLDIFTGPAGGGLNLPRGTAGGGTNSQLWGPAGHAPIGCYVTSNGLGFDNKSRFDFFISQQHAALYIDGQLIRQSDIPAGTFPWANQPVKIYFAHYVYHTENDMPELLQGRCGPMNSYWFNNPMKGTTASSNFCNLTYPAGYGFPRSDERHWDDMGFEVLPATAAPARDFSTLSAAVQPPVVRPPFTGPIPAAPKNLRITRLLEILGLTWGAETRGAMSNTGGNAATPIEYRHHGSSAAAPR